MAQPRLLSADPNTGPCGRSRSLSGQSSLRGWLLRDHDCTFLRRDNFRRNTQHFRKARVLSLVEGTEIIVTETETAHFCFALDGNFMAFEQAWPLGFIREQERSCDQARGGAQTLGKAEFTN